MNSRLLYVYGVLLALAALTAMVIIGVKTRNLMFTCLAFSLFAIARARISEKKPDGYDTFYGIIPLGAFIVFAYRAAINLLALIGIVQHELDQYDAYNKCLNLIFLIFLASGSLTTALIIFAQNKKEN